MLVPPTERLKVAKYASGAGYAPDQWARALAGVDWDKAELLSDKPASSVWRAELVVQKRPMTLVIKCEPIDSLKRKLQKVIRRTHAFRHWRGAELLMKHGFRTAEPKAVVYGRRDGVEVECLIMEALAGRTLLAFMSGTQALPELRRLTESLADHLAQLWRRGLFNRDSKPSNLIVAEGASSIIELDVVGLGSPRWLDESEWARVCRDLVLEPTGCGVRPSRASMMRFCRSLHRRLSSKSAHTPASGPWREFRDDMWASVNSMVMAHGDPTPEHNPLGRASETSPERE